MPAFEWVHVQLHQQKGMISLSPPTICNSARKGNAGGASARPGFPGAAGARSFEARPDGDRCPAGLTCHQTVILRMAVATWVYVNVPRGNGSQTSARDSSAFC
ncbi:hypothetical protein CJ256_27890 (plasmid) [Klebsiella pneumoniae]|nr:hypothetical protein CJ257_27530 [Klebsiella pneumoniae]AYC92079.1 hypothetical protein CJ256_27890 [Klebsiella pneumoniae]AYD32269.1 hypothetical protein CJ259_27630 [Klebsiella pneumoniae]AYD37373.1 hypothetical protein CJ258_26735 [Klebsiella pneumoniae]